MQGGHETIERSDQASERRGATAASQDHSDIRHTLGEAKGQPASGSAEPHVGDGTGALEKDAPYTQHIYSADRPPSGQPSLASEAADE
jgi:hypothetical protein